MDTLFGIRTDTLRGVAWMMGVLASFLSMAMAGRFLLGEIGIFELLFLRGGVCLVVLLALLPHFGVKSLATRCLHLHLGRNVIQFAGQWGWFYGIAWIPLSSVFSMEFTIPVWTAILGATFLGEALTRARVLSILLGFVGVMIILRPGMEAVHPASLAVLFAAFCFSSAYIFTRYMTRTESNYAILFYMIVIQLPLSASFAYFEWVWPEARHWPWIVIVGLTALTSQYCLARAFRLAEATIMVPFDFLRLPLGAIAGYLVFGDALDALVFVGAVIIFGGNFIAVWAERQRQ